MKKTFLFRERPFNLKGVGGLWFFSKKNILILVEVKKKSDSEFLSYNLMLYNGKKIRVLRDKKKIF